VVLVGESVKAITKKEVEGQLRAVFYWAVFDPTALELALGGAAA